MQQALSYLGFPGGSAGKESACNVEDLGSIPGLGRSPGEGNGYPLQYSSLENSMGCIVYGVAKNQTQLSEFHFTFLSYLLNFLLGDSFNNTVVSSIPESLFWKVLSWKANISWDSPNWGESGFDWWILGEEFNFKGKQWSIFPLMYGTKVRLSPKHFFFHFRRNVFLHT